MADLLESEFGTSIYRSSDPIKNLKIRVKLRKVTSATGLPQSLFGKRGGGDTDRTFGKDVELTDFKSTRHISYDEDEFIFGWQEKVFSQREFQMYSIEGMCNSVLEQKYHSEVKGMRTRPTTRLFSYVDCDTVPHLESPCEQVTTSPYERQTFVAERMRNLRHRRVKPVRQQTDEDDVLPKMNIVNQRPSKDMAKREHIVSTPVQTMYIMADLSPLNREEKYLSDEYLLCTIKVDTRGVISISPDFSHGEKPYVVETETLGKDVFEYSLENASQLISHQEQDKENKMYQELYDRHTDFLQACVGSQFEMPPPKVLRLLCYGEIISAQDYEYDNLYVHCFLELPQLWRIDASCQQSWVTQTCSTTIVETSNVSHFGFPFECELFYKNELAEGDRADSSIHGWPQLFVEVLSLDMWHRYRTEGYGYMSFPTEPGCHTMLINTWRPIGRSVNDELRRFFIGGSPELEDPTCIAVPSTFEGNRLSKFGFKTESTGSVKIKLNIIQQSRAFLDSKSRKQTFASLVDKLGVSMMQEGIISALQKFSRARHRMMTARQSIFSLE